MTTNILKAAAALAVAALGLWVYASFDPAVNHLFPRCPFKVATGWDCPGCGSQRAIHAILTGHIADAWRFNAALIPSLFILLLIFATRIFPRRLEPLRAFLGSQAFILSLFAAYILWAIARNTILPH